jgi:formamidopyrimidine-DNA glycosylase
MPELPEVETIRTYIDEKAAGRRIENMIIYLPRLIKNCSGDELKQALTGRRITGCSRKGKYLFLHTDGAMSLLIHLRMTGSLIYETGKGEEIRAQRIIFMLDTGRLIYRDIRTLGCLWLVPSVGLTGIQGYDTLGPDGNSPDFTAAYLYSKLKTTHRKIKPFLLDQTQVAGLGNIYVDEALFLAGLRPSRRCDAISKAAVQRLCEAIHTVLAEGLANGGTTVRNFIGGSGKEGQNQSHLRVYGREGKPCLACGTTIRYVKLAGRGTHYCPHCQR